MKRIFLLMVMLAVGMTAMAQNAGKGAGFDSGIDADVSFGQNVEQQHYIYIIVTVSGSFKSEGIKVDIDDGQNVDRLKDKNGKKMTFKTPAAVLMYFISEGWEMYVSGASTSGSSASGTGVVSTTSYWIMRKPCTKEEFEKAVSEGRKK